MFTSTEKAKRTHQYCHHVAIYLALDNRKYRHHYTVFLPFSYSTTFTPICPDIMKSGRMKKDLQLGMFGLCWISIQTLTPTTESNTVRYSTFNGSKIGRNIECVKTYWYDCTDGVLGGKILHPELPPKKKRVFKTRKNKFLLGHLG